MLSDVHCHLNELTNIEKEIKKAKDNGIHCIVSNSVDALSMLENISLSKKFSEVKICLGLHPCNILLMNSKTISSELSFIENNIEKCIAIGEIGLDFHHAKTQSQQKIQEKIFEKQIEIALNFKKPIEVHSRKAKNNVLNTLERKRVEKALLHWFFGSKNQVKRILDNNFLISIGPSILFENHSSFLKSFPIENILLETDSPVTFNGEKAKPFWIKKIALKLAEIKELEFKELEKILQKNFTKLFKK
jgi:TatD DNase family protein